MRFKILLLFGVILISACGGGAEATATLPPTRTATALPTATPAALPTRTSVQPTEAPAQPTEAPTQPTEAPVQPTEAPAATATVTAPPPTPTATTPPEPTPTSAPVAGGRLSFRDNLAVADQLVLTMRGIAPPPQGSAYEGWLIADDGVTEISTGVFPVSADGQVDYVWTSPTGENLIAKYASFAVTVEPADDSDPGPTSQVAFRGAAEPDVLTAARRVFAGNDGEPATPRNVSFGQGLLSQSQLANDHINNAFNAAAIGAYGEMQIHGEHVINIVAGTSGPRFGDYTGDGRPENPGDGFGALVYAQQIATLLPGVEDELAAVEDLLTAIQDKAEEIVAAPDLPTAQPTLDELKAIGAQLVGEAVPAFYAAAQAAVSYPVSPSP